MFRELEFIKISNIVWSDKRNLFYETMFFNEEKEYKTVHLSIQVSFVHHNFLHLHR